MQVTFQPFACKLLDTLQRLSFYVLEITLFLLMVASFDDIADDRVRFVCLAVVGALNGFVLLVFACFIIRGLKRMLVGCWWRVANRCAAALLSDRTIHQQSLIYTRFMHSCMCGLGSNVLCIHVC